MAKRLSKYKTDGGSIFPCVVGAQTELLSFGSTANEPPPGGPTTDVTLAIRKDVGEVGITSRKVYVRWRGSPPLGYEPGRGFYVPILTPELFAAIAIGQIGQYIGTEIQVRKKIKERLK